MRSVIIWESNCSTLCIRFSIVMRVCQFLLTKYVSQGGLDMIKITCIL